MPSIRLNHAVSILCLLMTMLSGCAEGITYHDVVGEYRHFCGDEILGTLVFDAGEEGVTTVEEKCDGTYTPTGTAQEEPCPVDAVVDCPPPSPLDTAKICLKGDPALCTAECVPASQDTGPDDDVFCLQDCGDDIVEGDEKCDGNCPETFEDCGGATPCIQGDPDQCLSECVAEPENNTVADGIWCENECGNGVVEAANGESCDGDCLTAQDCKNMFGCAMPCIDGSAAECNVECAAEDALNPAQTCASGC